MRFSPSLLSIVLLLFLSSLGSHTVDILSMYLPCHIKEVQFNSRYSGLLGLGIFLPCSLRLRCRGCVKDVCVGVRHPMVSYLHLTNCSCL